MPVSRKNPKRGRKSKVSEASRARQCKNNAEKKAEKARQRDAAMMKAIQKEMGLL